MPVKVGYAEGVCFNCGKKYSRQRPGDYAFCDCYLYCPLCGKKMTAYTPDLTPTTYGPIESETALGEVNHPMNILYYCQDCRYYSTLKPVEVQLS